MKRLLLIIISILIVSGCNIKEKSPEELKKTIVENIDKIVDKANKKVDYSFSNNRYFKRIVKIGEEAVPIIINLYYDGELDDTRAYIAISAIQEITDCNLFETYGLYWENPDEFFEMWKNNNCFYQEKANKESYSVTDNVGELLSKYLEFSDVVNECEINIPIFKDMVPQGVSVMGNYILITAYDSSGQHNSKCYVLNKNGEIKNIVTLDTNSHVGSIDYDEINDLIWIPGNNGSLYAYDANEFVTNKEVDVKIKFENLSSGLTNYLDSSKNQIAYLCIDEDYLYIGSFSVFGKGCVKQFKIVKNETGEIILDFIKKFKVPTKIQGVTFLKKDNEKFMILSKSYGRHNSSSLYMYRYNDEIEDYTSSSVVRTSIIMPPMLEQITMSDSLYAIFESNAKKFNDASEKVGSICLLNADKILAKFLEKENSIQKELEEKAKKKTESKNEKGKKDGEKKTIR